MVFGSLGFLFGDLITPWPNLLRWGHETKLSEKLIYCEIKTKRSDLLTSRENVQKTRTPTVQQQLDRKEVM